MSFLPKFKKVALVSRVPQVARAFLLFAICYLLFAIFAPARASAVSRWGPHLVCYSSAEMMARVRQEYNNAGTTDWIPATIIITSSDTQDTILRILNDAHRYQIIPIFRLEGPGFSGPLTADEARKAAQTISAAVSAGPPFPRRIYVEVGNEPNLWNPPWGAGQQRIINYNASLTAFLDAAWGIGTLNGALDLSNPSDGNMLDAKEFWDKFPDTTIRRVSGTAHNPYDGVGAPPVGPPYPSNIRGTIDAWRWEKDVMARKGAGGPTFLLEFGFNPQASVDERLNFLRSEHSANRHAVEAITPLFHEPDKIVIFGPPGSGKVWLIGPVGGAGSCGGGVPSTIDTGYGSGPSWGEDVVLSNTVEGIGTREAEATLGGRAILRVPNPLDLSGIEIGPEIELQLSELQPYVGKTARSLPHLIFDALLRGLNLPAVELSGQVFHPVCRVTATQGNPKMKPVEVDDWSTFKTPSFWTTLLGATKLTQAIGVVGFSSGVNLTAPQPPELGEKENEQMPTCPQPAGPEPPKLATGSQNYSKVTALGWVGAIIDFFKDLWGLLFPDRRYGTVEVVVKPKKFLPGEETFKNQTSEEQKGFLRSFCPSFLCPPADNSQETGRYRVGNNFQDRKHEYKGVCGTHRGYTLLDLSLFPQSMQALVDRSLSAPCE